MSGGVMLGASYLGNTVGEYLFAVGAFIVILVVLKIFREIILGRLKAFALKTKTDIDDAAIKIIQSMRPPFYLFLAIYFSLSFITIPAGIRGGINAILVIFVVYQAVIAFNILIAYAAEKSVGRERSNKPIIDLMGRILKGVVWAFAAVFVLSNLGVDVTSFIAGIGIGGIAIAFALQNILEDLFSTFVIFFDKPFVVGDFIIVGEHLGVVEKVGIKTTRIRALQGEEIVISNRELTAARIQNFKKMEKRRVVLSFGVTYDTPSAKLQKIPHLVRNIIGGIRIAKFDRAHFMQFADSSLNFEVVYYISSPDYNQHMDVQQDILFRIKEVFEKEKISMAFPTRTVYMEKA